ncbi:M56 family metallopeptidase [Candidatus Latescibacterota bacterium]
MYTIDWLSSLDSIGFQVFCFLISVLWQSLILLSAIGLLAYFFKFKKETTGYFLWVAAIVIIPSIPFLTHLISIAGTPNTEISIIPSYSDPHTRVIKSQIKNKYELKMHLPTESNSVDGKTANITDRFVPLSARTYMFSGFTDSDQKIIRLSIIDYKWALFFISYFLIVALFLLWELIGRLRIRNWIVHGSTVTDSYIISTFLDAKIKIGLSKEFKIIENKHVSSPMTTRIWSPVIILPEGFADKLSACELRAVAIHELSHIKRNDVLIFSFIHILRALFFFFPFVWRAVRQISCYAEIACDNMVIVHTGEKVTYAKFLTRLAEKLSNNKYSTGLSVGIIVSKSIFYRRIEAIFSTTGKSVRKLTLAAIAGLIATVMISLLAALTFPLGDAGEDIDLLTITGHVVFEGKRVSGADIYFSEPWSKKAEKVARSKKNGAFKFKIPRSRLIHPNRSMPALIAFEKSCSIGWVMIKNVWDVDGLKISLYQPETITGTIVDNNGNPVRGANVSLRGLSNPHFRNVNEHHYYALYERSILPENDSKTDGHGRFAINNIPKGYDAVITCKRGGYAETHIKNIPAGMNNMVITMNPGASIGGRLSYGDSGKPARNIALRIGRVNNKNEFIDFYSEAKTDLRGYYKADNLPPGNYSVFLRDPLSDWTAVAKNRIHVEDGKTEKGVDLRLIRGGFVTGRILDKDTKKPLAGHLIRYSDESHPTQKGFTFAHSNMTYTDENGFYCFRAAPGKITISTTGTEGYEIYYQCKTMELSDNVTITYSDFNLTKAIAVTGKVLNFDGTPSIGMHIKIPNDKLIDGGYAGLDDYVITDFEGRFTINGLKECDSFELEVYDARGNYKNTINFYVKPRQEIELINKSEYSLLFTEPPNQSQIPSTL